MNECRTIIISADTRDWCMRYANAIYLCCIPASDRVGPQIVKIISFSYIFSFFKEISSYTHAQHDTFSLCKLRKWRDQSWLFLIRNFAADSIYFVCKNEVSGVFFSRLDEISVVKKTAFLTQKKADTA